MTHTRLLPRSPRSRGWSWLLLFCLAGCSTVTTHCKKNQRALQPRVQFTTSNGKTLTVHVELACTPDERQRGLMYRKTMKTDHGMLFVFPKTTEQSFWMKNTYIPLDMIHIDKSKKIVGIVENATPHTTTSRTVGKPALYVLEVNAFFARKHGIQPGQTVTFVDVPYCALP